MGARCFKVTAWLVLALACSSMSEVEVLDLQDRVAVGFGGFGFDSLDITPNDHVASAGIAAANSQDGSSGGKHDLAESSGSHKSQERRLKKQRGKGNKEKMKQQGKADTSCANHKGDEKCNKWKEVGLCEETDFTVLMAKTCQKACGHCKTETKTQKKEAAKKELSISGKKVKMEARKATAEVKAEAAGAAPKKAATETTATFTLRLFKNSGKCDAGNTNPSNPSSSTSKKTMKLNEWTLVGQYGARGGIKRNEWWIYYIYIKVASKGCNGKYCIMLDKRAKKFACVYLKKKEQKQPKGPPPGKWDGFSSKNIYIGTNFLKQQKCVPVRKEREATKDKFPEGDWFWTTACANSSPKVVRHHQKYCKRGGGFYNLLRQPKRVIFSPKTNKKRASIGFDLLSPNLPTPPAAHADTEYVDHTERKYYPMRVGEPGDCFSKCKDLPSFLMASHQNKDKLNWNMWKCVQAKRLGCDINSGVKKSPQGVKYFELYHHNLTCCKHGHEWGTWRFAKLNRKGQCIDNCDDKHCHVSYINRRI